MKAPKTPPLTLKPLLPKAAKPATKALAAATPTTKKMLLQALGEKISNYIK